jgi:hypothetical protein
MPSNVSKELREQLVKHALKCESKHSLDSMVQVARPMVAIDHNELNRDGLLLKPDTRAEHDDRPGNEGEPLREWRARAGTGSRCAATWP